KCRRLPSTSSGVSARLGTGAPAGTRPRKSGATRICRISGSATAPHGVHLSTRPPRSSGSLPARRGDHMRWTISPLLISLLAACFEPRSLLEEPRPEGWFDPGVAESRAAPALQLYLEEGRYTLPDTSLPPGYDVDRRVVVDLKPTRGARWRGRLPF